ncbi:S9 family peptidase [Puniceicoccales bacterium CK1056]|uniref:S9 family peptidase n=1 Tax=Oceanipulchritudo coccoides TaxID=2706888 RepID=A0A6B2M1X2_9BACT|nr:S9 family peptidase [Oceanipulchritudo coccoides]NDV62376.1 S9 family peptidase [Oceanipulchritudo coccoides]
MNEHLPHSIRSVAPELPVKHQHHGVTRVDPWHWLRERENPNVLAHLKAENTHTENWFARTGNLRDEIYQDLIGRIEQSNCSAVYPKGDYFYQSRIRKGQEYRAYYRKQRLIKGDWELYFDANEESRGEAYFDLGLLDISPDGNILAYSIDTAGEESYILRFRNLATGEDLPGRIENTCAEGEWDASGKNFYFVMEDETRRPDRIYRHRVGTNPGDAELVYTEADPLYYASIYKSQDSQFLFAVSESKETSEIHFMEAHIAKGKFQILFPRRPSIQYSVDHHEGHWLIRTNEDAPDFKLLRLPVNETGLQTAEVMVPPSDKVRLNDLLVLKDFLLLFEQTGGLDRIRVKSLRGEPEHFIEMPDPVYDLQESINAEYDTNFFNFTVSSPIRPSSTFRYNLKTRQSKLLREAKVPSGHDPERYTTYRINATGEDGVRIPVTVVHLKALGMDGSHPLYIHAYGAYGETVECGFRTSWLTWLERGFVVAIAHVRGGGLLGESWYQDGKLEKKENSFRDFIACADCLIEKGYSKAGKILIEGGSAGGLLVGAAINMRPELFKAAVATVPFVDVVTTMLDPSLPLTTIEYEEWGNPQEPEVFRRLLAYSPYDNIRETEYPALLATAGFNDPRVPYWEAAKWVAKLRKNQKGKNPILLKTNLDTGHSGASGRYEYWKEIAAEQAFLLTAIQPLDVPGS